jgi:uncharacterized RDD family membrane protein YckC
VCNGKLAPPAKRLIAHLLDVFIPVVAILSIFGIGLLGAAGGGPRFGALGPLVGFVLLVAYIVWALRLFANGTTPGKNALHLRVVKENGCNATFGTMFLREWIGKLISAMVFSLGYIWILLDPDRQGWHDKLVGTYVVD